MGRLIIIGNGFDLHYKLKTKPKDFLDFLGKESIYNEIENPIKVFERYEVYWSDFEEDIAYINLDKIEKEQLSYPDYLSDHEYDRDYCIQNMQKYLDSIITAIFSALQKMVIAADSVELIRDNRDFKKTDEIISFNYTTTVERVAVILPDSPVFYIHGCASREDNLILGYHEAMSEYSFEKYSSPEDGDFYLESQLNLLRRFYSSLKKKRKEQELKEYLLNLKGINEVVVFGQAIGKVDAPYFELINAILRPKQWRISYHGNNDKVLDNINELSFKNIISLFQW